MIARPILLEELERRLPRGRRQPMAGAVLAADLGVSERTIRELAGELIDLGVLVGSTCSGERAGYFICQDERDLEVGTGHLVARARAMFRRVSRLRRSAKEQFGPSALRLFDLDEEGAT